MENILKLAADCGSPLLLFSPRTFRKRYTELQTALPRVKHHFALKSLPYEGCIQVVRDCAGYLDVASTGEMQLVAQTAPELLGRCIYTHPIKKKRDIETALAMGIRVMVADNRFELEKMKPYADQIRLLVRVAFPNPEARCDLSAKFGAPFADAPALITECYKSGFDLLGCSFHVGSQMTDPSAHLRAIVSIKKLYDWNLAHNGIEWPVLNIGGGFPARLDAAIPSLPAFCAPLRRCLDEWFPNTEIWSEPGRCLATDAMAAVSQVVGKALKNNCIWYYLDDGVYNTFSGKIYDHAAYRHRALGAPQHAPCFPSVLAGPTCDSIDVLEEAVQLPELNPGDFIYTPQVGAYGWASRTDFNQLDPSVILHTDADLSPEFSCPVEAYLPIERIERPDYSVCLN